MAGLDNLIPMNERSKEEVREIATKGGINSGKARKEKATMRKTLEMLLETTNKNGKTYKELVTLGLIQGAVKGNSQNFRTIVELLGELTGEQVANTPPLKIEIVDNSELEKTLYETNQLKENDNRE